MGTNYYIRRNECKHCDRYDEEHLGKSSYGRDFAIYWNKEKYNSFNEFKEFLKGKTIYDEYGKPITLKKFLNFLEMKREKHPFAHKKTMNEYPDGSMYIDGYYFIPSTFC